MLKNHPLLTKQTSTFKIVIFILAGASMIGHGLRMIYQGVFHPGSFYKPNTFDLLFDWTTLTILGLLVLSYGFLFLKSMYASRENKQAITP